MGKSRLRSASEDSTGDDSKIQNVDARSSTVDNNEENENQNTISKSRSAEEANKDKDAEQKVGHATSFSRPLTWWAILI